MLCQCQSGYAYTVVLSSVYQAPADSSMPAQGKIYADGTSVCQNRSLDIPFYGRFDCGQSVKAEECRPAAIIGSACSYHWIPFVKRGPFGGRCSTDLGKTQDSGISSHMQRDDKVLQTCSSHSFSSRCLRRAIWSAAPPLPTISDSSSASALAGSGSLAKCIPGKSGAASARPAITCRQPSLTLRLLLHCPLGYIHRALAVESSSNDGDLRVSALGRKKCLGPYTQVKYAVYASPRNERAFGWSKSRTRL